VKVTFSLDLPDRLVRALRGARRLARSLTGRREGGPNLWGDRDIEGSWISSRMPSGPGTALDFGCGNNPLGLEAAMRGFEVTAVDLIRPTWFYSHPRLSFVRGDLLELPLPEGSFDLVLNCSVVEHVGLPDRYGIVGERPDGDLEAMARLRQLMKPGGVMLLTIPVGVDAVVLPLHRVYGRVRLPLLIDGFEVEAESYWVKAGANRWTECERETALSRTAGAGSRDPALNLYALGCFALKAPGGGG
jgi:SAM-dependent methyltransferase